MKKLLLSLFCYVMVWQLWAQNSPCTAALPSYQFQQRLREVKNAASETERLNIAKQFLAQYCITAEQAKQIAEAFANDFDRLDFAKIAYKRTIDQDNFYDVYDAFGYFSNVFRLHDYIQQQKAPVFTGNTNGGNGTTNPPNPYPNTTVPFPSYQYPDAQQYQGATICQNPMNDLSFLAYYHQVKAQIGNQQRCDLAINIAQQQCFTTAQFMKLSSVFDQDEPKLDLLKRGLQYVYDIDNYYFAEQVFQNFMKKQEFKQYCLDHSQQQQIPPTGTGGSAGGPYPCLLDDATIAGVVQAIDQERFNNKRLNTARQQVQQKGACFTSAQMKTLVALFNFETSRLEMAKFGYSYVVDKEAYLNTVSDAFTFSTSRGALEKHVNGG